jgi:hypothetical protein
MSWPFASLHLPPFKGVSRPLVPPACPSARRRGRLIGVSPSFLIHLRVLSISDSLAMFMT